jgi:hypothetical protein
MHTASPLRAEHPGLAAPAQPRRPRPVSTRDDRAAARLLSDLIRRANSARSASSVNPESPRPMPSSRAVRQQTPRPKAQVPSTRNPKPGTLRPLLPTRDPEPSAPRFTAPVLPVTRNPQPDAPTSTAWALISTRGPEVWAFRPAARTLLSPRGPRPAPGACRSTAEAPSSTRVLPARVSEAST